MSTMSHFVYILECQKNRLYTGYARDVEKRFAQHVDGTAKCKFTRGFPPIRIAARWEFESKSEALKAEYAIKQLSKAQKQELIAKRCSVFDEIML